MTERTDKTFRRRERLDDAARHELDAIDRVLVGRHAESAEDAEIAQFALRLRAERPTLNEAAVARLDARLADPIARERAAAARRGDRSGLRRRLSALASRPAPLAGAVATLLVVVAVSASLIGDSRDSSVVTGDSTIDAPSAAEPNTATDTAAGEQGGRAANRAAESAPLSDVAKVPAGSAHQDFAADSTAQRVSGETGSGVRRVERSADLTLATPGSKVEDVADDVIATTDRFGGYVVSSSVSGGDAGNASAEFVLRLPSNRFEQALAAYSGLAHVRSRTQGTQDITDSYERAADRLKTARAETARLRAKLATTTDEAAAKAIRVQLRTAEARESARRREMQSMRNRVSNVTMGVSIVADETAEAADRGTIEKALHSAASVLTTLAAIAIISLAVLAPLALLFAAGRFTLRRLRRGRADGAIDSSATKRRSGTA